jgi:pyridoxal phosphate-dependent aminotransferase EpsN
MSRIYLSPPDIGDAERAAVDAAMRSGWIAPLGPDLTAFEKETAEATGRRHAVGLGSGTAALHLALLEAKVGAGDDVLVSTFTFAASVNPIAYCGATPVLIDSEPVTWNMSPDLLAEELSERTRQNRRPRAVVVVDLYGQCAEYARIEPICTEYEVVCIEDSAESLGAWHAGRRAGSFGTSAVVSFNGNKIITTSGGGMLITDDEGTAAHARHLATQARDPAPHYEHSEIGFNYRMSNLLAALGRPQLATLSDRIARRRAVNLRYRAALEGVEGVSFQRAGESHRPNHWLTCINLAPELETTPAELRAALEREDIEARPTWKPMHLQPVYAHVPRRVDGTSEGIFRTALCLPSGSNLSEVAQDRVIEVLLQKLSR